MESYITPALDSIDISANYEFTSSSQISANTPSPISSGNLLDITKNIYPLTLLMPYVGNSVTFTTPVPILFTKVLL